MTRTETLAEGVVLHLGDCRDVLPTLGGVDCLLTDAPYLVTSGGFGALEGGFGGWIKDAYDNKIDPRYFDIACRRISEALKQPDFFVERPKPAKQEAMI